MTYPDFCVAASINEFYVPVQINVDKGKDLVRKYQVIWTPNINILDPSESLLYHVEGWLPPSGYSAMLMAAHGRYFLSQKKFPEAKDVLQKVWEKFPQSDFAAESLYSLGVSGYS